MLLNVRITIFLSLMFLLRIVNIRWVIDFLYFILFKMLFISFTVEVRNNEYII